MTTLTFKYTATFPDNSVKYGNISFYIYQSSNDVMLYYYTKDSNSKEVSNTLIITKAHESGDYSSLYRFVYSQIGYNMSIDNGIVLYSSSNYDDPKFYTSKNRELIITIVP